jgi:NAD(P)-dependent dehydrogenase (short-subunit alcohol dehydrogenase family)
MSPWDVRGKTALVTGATGGIGFETALGLGQSGAEVLVHGRTRAKAEAAAVRLQAAAPGAIFTPLAADFERLGDVRKLAETLLQGYSRLDILINNAGAWLGERAMTEDGHERLWQGNHLAPFLLTIKLEPLLRASAPARIITVSSNAHYSGRIDFDDLDAGRQRYDGFAIYCRTKLANVLFSNALARRYEGAGVSANALHPGVVNTGIAASARRGLAVLFRMMKPFYLSAANGADTSLWLARAPEAAAFSGAYFVKRRSVAPLPDALDPALQERLWQVSAAQVGL